MRNTHRPTYFDALEFAKYSIRCFLCGKSWEGGFQDLEADVGGPPGQEGPKDSETVH